MESSISPYSEMFRIFGLVCFVGLLIFTAVVLVFGFVNLLKNLKYKYQCEHRFSKKTDNNIKYCSEEPCYNPPEDWFCPLAKRREKK